MKNTLFNMVLVLGCITLVASAGVGSVYRLTEKTIARTDSLLSVAAVEAVLPPFDKISRAELVLNDIPTVVNTATSADEIVGYAVTTATNKGFSGTFRLMVGFSADGRVRAVKVLEHSETPGLGSKMTDEGNPLFASFEGRNPAAMKLLVRKDGGDIDALTAATITSRAYVDAVDRAFRALAQVGAEAGMTDAPTDTTTGATATDTTTAATEAAANDTENTPQQ